jgi:uncharacterized GH25 family protein
LVIIDKKFNLVEKFLPQVKFYVLELLRMTHDDKAVYDITTGHEIWIESGDSHIHQNDEITLFVGFGHALQTDGPGEREKWSAFAISPSGKKLFLTMEGGENDKGRISFTPEEKGDFTVVVENNFGIGTKLRNGEFRRKPRKDLDDVDWSAYYYQYALVSVSAGDAIGKQKRGVCDLEIIATPEENDTYHIEVFYYGSPLSHGKVEVTRASDPSHSFFNTIELNGEGQGTCTFSEKDLWMLKVSHGDSSRRIAGWYDRVQLAATLTLNNQNGSF